MGGFIAENSKWEIFLIVVSSQYKGLDWKALAENSHFRQETLKKPLQGTFISGSEDRCSLKVEVGLAVSRRGRNNCYWAKTKVAWELVLSGFL